MPQKRWLLGYQSKADQQRDWPITLVYILVALSIVCFLIYHFTPAIGRS